MAKKKTAAKTYATHITTPTGQRIYVSGKTREELEEKVFMTKLEMRAGVDVKNDVLFSDYAPVWLRAYKKSKVRPSSYALIETNLRLHVLPFFEGMTLKEIKPMHIQMYLAYLSKESGNMQTKCMQILTAILRAAADNGLIVKSPVRQEDKPAPSTKEPEEPLTDEQAQRLLDALTGTRAYTFCLLALATGMRRGEILGLMWEDIDFDEAVIHVRHNKAFVTNQTDAPVTELLKTEAARRKLPMSPVLTEHLLAAREESESPFVLSMKNGKSLSKSAFRSMWKAVDRRTVGKGGTPRELGDSYGDVRVILDFDVHPHLLRHTYVTKLFEKGLDIKQVQHLAGHATPDMTMRVYNHYREKQRAAETHEQVCVALDYLVLPGAASVKT